MIMNRKRLSLFVLLIFSAKLKEHISNTRNTCSCEVLTFREGSCNYSIRAKREQGNKPVYNVSKCHMCINFCAVIRENYGIKE